MLILVLVCAVSSAVLFLTALYYFRTGFKKSTLLFLWAVRVLIILALLCAFFQPVLNIPTIAPKDRGAVVLLDVSKSMRLFDADSSLSRFLTALPDLSSGKQRGIPVNLVYFGDSARTCSPGLRPSFSDEHSYFPNQLGQDQSFQSRVLIILSDGNWSNPSLPRGVLEDKTCYYVQLPKFSPRPYLRMECISAQRPVVQDSVSIARLLIQGYAKTGGSVDISATASGRRVARAACKVRAGYFSDTVSVRLPSSRPGRSLCTIVAVDSTDTLNSILYYVCDVVPRAIKASVCATQPTLDKRFITLALSKSNAWKLEGPGGDVLFILGWDDAAREALSTLKPSGTVVFIGCMPGEEQTVVPDTFSLISLLPDDSLARRLELQRMPPPSEIVINARALMTSMHPVLGCIARKAALHDTLPFLAYGKYESRSALFCAARNVWAMEFLPLSVDRENETFSFLEYIVSIAKNQFLRNLNRNFFMYPAASEILALDSVAFCIITPSEMAPAAHQSGSIHFTLGSLGDKNNSVLDTTFTLEPNEVSGIQTIRLRPFPSGTYFYKASLSSKETRLDYTDTLYIQDNNLEMSIHGQNTLVLNELAIPLDMTDTAGLRTILAHDSSPENQATITRTIQIRQSWWLLAVLFVLFGLEWLIRRKIRLDS